MGGLGWNLVPVASGSGGGGRFDSRDWVLVGWRGFGIRRADRAEASDDAPTAFDEGEAMAPSVYDLTESGGHKSQEEQGGDGVGRWVGIGFAGGEDDSHKQQDEAVHQFSRTAQACREDGLPHRRRRQLALEPWNSSGSGRCVRIEDGLHDLLGEAASDPAYPADLSSQAGGDPDGCECDTCDADSCDPECRWGDDGEDDEEGDECCAPTEHLSESEADPIAESIEI